ncbi:MAG: RES family NAD+ phosphorylase [Gemmatimonadota bacterium]|nr:RES family NAD+ phosphorylase [Gemmatimonadota bacterium]
MSARTLWRVFPWDERASEGDRFSPSFVPPPTGRGRFDLPHDISRVLYLAESPEHAVAELLHPWRGRSVDARHLVRAGRPLAAVEVQVDEDRSGTKVADLCEPDVLVALDVAPDRTASRHRTLTQPIARTVWDAGFAGLRWWSRFWGDWHTTVLFTARLEEGVAERGGGVARPLSFGTPEPLTPTSPAVAEAARALGIAVEG